MRAFKCVCIFLAYAPTCMHVQKIRELESVNNGSPGGTWADTGGNGGAGVGGDDARVLELQATVTALRNKLESTEITLAEERSRHQQVFFSVTSKMVCELCEISTVLSAVCGTHRNMVKRMTVPSSGAALSFTMFRCRWMSSHAFIVHVLAAHWCNTSRVKV